MMGILRLICKLALALGVLGWPAISLWAQTTNAPVLAPGQAMILAIEPAGRVEFSRAGPPPPVWDPGYVGQILRPGDRVKVQKDGRLLLRFSNQSTAWVGEKADFQIDAPPNPKAQSSIALFLGRIFFFDRDRPGEHRIRSRTASTAVRGTEFTVEVDEADRMTVSVLDGEVVLSNAQGEIPLRNHEQGRAEPGQKPHPTARIDAINDLIQWCLYYPAVLDLDELQLSPQEQAALTDSLTAYRQGNLLAALASYPTQRQPASDSERVYLAALLLSVGNVEEAEKQLSQLNDVTAQNGALADALRKLIAAVTGSTSESAIANSTAFLAESYYEQSQGHLEAALRAARQAVEKSPKFGFGWERVAELEFSFGRIGKALTALEKSLNLAPRNPEALALKGFLLTAQNRVTEAIPYFDQAIAIDASLGNAWLGRGLCRIRQGQAEAGRQDIQVAASVEPQRSLFRSYLSKAYEDAGDLRHADHEIELAKALDPRDPTPWLYSALIRREQNEINPAVHELEESIQRNDNRALYRSKLLMDQDRAVRSSSLATLYQSAGMDEVSVREAAKAVSADYANYSAHLFLSDSFNALRDPTRFNLRYETPWFNELLLANLLSPVGGTPLSQNISQQEYARLFERNRIGLSSDTEYRSDGQVRELASQFGRLGRTAWALDLDYQHNDGVRPNNKLERIEWYSTVKQQLTAADSLLLLTKYQDYHSGDNYQRYDQSVVRTNFSFDEYQHPLLAIGYHHEWQPGVHTLLLGARLENDQRISDKAVHQLVLSTNAFGQVTNAQTLGVGSNGQDIGGGMDVSYRSRLEIYSGELNQIFQSERNTLILGGRVQGGNFTTDDLLTNVRPPGAAFLFMNPPAQARVDGDFERESVYGYYTLKPLSTLQLTAGATYDRIRYPANFRNPPISPGEETRHQFGPKAAMVWSPIPELTLRGAYSRSLGGVSLDESVRLEPSQLVGFNQSFRSVISESIVGSVSAPKYEVFGGALDLKLPSRTFFGVQGQLLSSDLDRSDGVFAYTGVVSPNSAGPFSTRERLEYQEPSVAVTVNQLAGDEWSFGAQYRFTHSRLHTEFPDIPTAVLPSANRVERADLHQATIFALYNHPSGFFARIETQWYHQQNFGYSPSLPSEDFYQHNIFLGYRLPRQRGDVSFGVLNLADSNYRLNPLNPYSELPRERVYAARLRIRL